jgi:hypothetical protein
MSGVFYKQLVSRRVGKSENKNLYIILNAFTKDVATKGKISVSHSQWL